MHSLTTILVALLATLAVAAPAKPNVSNKRAFSVAVSHRKPREPAAEMARIFHKYGFHGKDHSPVAAQSAGSDKLGQELAATTVEVVSVFATTVITLSPAAQPTDAGPADSAIPVSASVSYFSYQPHKASTTKIAALTSAANPAQQTTVASSNSTKTNSTSSSGSVHASPEQNDQSYLAPVTIGNQPLNLDFDTGSADLWVFSTALSPQLSAGHKLFNPSSSSSFTPYQGGSWAIQYGDGSSASGTVGFDSVTIGGVTASHQAIEIADTVAATFARDHATSGLLGLAFSNINQVRPVQQKTFLENVLPSLPQPVFTANLATNAAGTYTFGSIDHSQYSGNSISYTPVDSSQGYWKFASGSFAVDGTTQSCTTCSPAIADTGTSLMLVDDEVASAYYARVSGAEFQPQTAGGWIYPCSTALPDLSVAIGDSMAVLKGDGLTYLDFGNGMCFGGVQSNTATAGESALQIYGDVFLRQVFAVFDAGNVRFGVAPKA